ncbi:serine/threonine-protein kinase [Lentisphaera profundi]|uniref:Serine/threonine-protein kinase n=1 Tax=Lentisphaera profundi TaxID=1658616 RepID=A0ABY7VQB8_9BACT|nr:serine/threonine-protein kinase [Lentisphaera profundi]WDE95440.1 serine/threonine-protein kinase [Lentisphaera profundi]
MNKNEITNNNFSKIFDEANSLLVDEAETPIIDSIKNEADRYSQLQEHAVGGHKIIYKCHDEYTDRFVALALLKDSCDHKKEELFLREGRINSLLQHPNIIPVYDMGFRNNSPFFTMKFIQGQTLGSLIKNLAMANQETCQRNELIDIFLKVCDAIAYCHSNGIAHLDLKPDNICIDEYGEVYVCDWGLAIVLDDSAYRDDAFSDLDKYSLNSIHQENQTIDGYLKGTPGYMAPEQTPLMKENKGRHSDIFSLGAMLYTILTLKKPFPADSIELILQKTVQGDFTYPSTLIKNLPAQLELICLKALQVPLDQRYASVEDFKNDILAFRNGFAISAEKNSNLKIVSLLIKRNKALVISLFLALVIISTSTFLFTVNLKKSKNTAIALAEKFRQKTQESDLRGSLLAKKIFADAKIQFQNDQFYQALELVNYSLELNPNNSLAKELKGLLCFITEDYPTALSSLSPLSKKDHFSQFILDYLSENQAPKSIEDFYKLTTKVNEEFGISNTLSSDLLHHKIYSKLTYQERLQLASLLLALSNADNEISLNYDAPTKYLSLANNPTLVQPYMLQNFPAQKADFSNTSIVNFITFRSMPLLSLNVSSTQIADLESLSNTSLRELYIAHTKIRDLSPLRNSTLQVLDIRGLEILDYRSLFSMQQLKTLITSPGQIDLKLKKKLNWRIKIIEKD